MSKRVRKQDLIKPAIAAGTVIAVAAVAVLCYNWFGKKGKEAMGDDVNALDVVTRGDLEVAITGEASVEPYERFEIISMVSGDILSSPYDVGDTVNKDDILYQFDTTDALSSIEKQKISLQQSKNSLANAKKDLQESRENLSITATNDGIIQGLSIKKGSSVSNNETIAQIENTRQLEVTLPFTKEQAANIYVGQKATLSSSVHMSTVDGYVQSISSEAVAQSDGSMVHSVKISFTNPGAFTEGLIVGGEINSMHSPGYGTVAYSESGTTKAKASGTIENVYYSNGDYITKGSVIATISSDSLESQERSIENSELSYKNAQLSMEDTMEGLNDYSIKSPISGTVITKNAKAGDTIDRTNSSTTLMVVADVSKLKFSLEIDELDVSSVKEGQRVDITCDALPNENFEGKITSISVEGTATNGVTTYTADVVIDNPGNLRPSMNIDASVIVESAQNVLIAPTSDIKTAMGVSYVFLKDETGTRGATEEDFTNAMRKNMAGNASSSAQKAQSDDSAPQGMPGNREGTQNAQGGTPDNQEARPNMQGGNLQSTPTSEDRQTQASPNGNAPSGNENTTKKTTGEKSENKEKQNNKNSGNTQQRSRLPEAPDGFVIAIVETGISDDEYTEIKSGLQENDQIQRLSTSSNTSNRTMGMGNMGGMRTGGMPGGAMGGAMGGRR